MRYFVWAIGLAVWSVVGLAQGDDPKKCVSGIPARIHGEPGWPPYEPNLSPTLADIGWLIRDSDGVILFAEDFAHRLPGAQPPCPDQIAKGGARPAGAEASDETSGT